MNTPSKLLASCLLLGCATMADAAALILYEVATPDVGLSAAGYAARAEDASTLFTNPAGMSRLEGQEIQFGLQGLYGDFAFQPNSNTTVSGTDGGNPIGFLPGSSIFYSHQINEKWSAGLGLFSYFGLAAEFDPNWVGRYYAKEVTLVGLTLMPSASYKINERWSVGAGLNAMYGVFEQKVAVNNPVLADGQLKIDDRTWGFGADIGVLYQMSENTRIGLTYLSPVKLDFKDTPEFTGLGPALTAALQAAGLLGTEIGLGMTVPQSVMLSGYHDLNDKLALTANVGWQNWSRFGKVGVGVNSSTPTSLTVDRNYQDTFHGALGAIYRFNDALRGTMGVAYDTSAVEDADRTVDFIVGDSWRIGAGLQYQISSKLLLTGAYNFNWMGDLSVDQNRGPLSGRVAGDFTGTAIHVFALNLRWMF